MSKTMCEECGFAQCPPGCPNYGPPVVHQCHNCDGEIYEDEIIYRIDGDIWCEHCIAECKEYAEPEEREE